MVYLTFDKVCICSLWWLTANNSNNRFVTEILQYLGVIEKYVSKNSEAIISYTFVTTVL